MRSSLVITDSLVWTAETEYALSVAAAEAEAGARVTVAAPEGGPVEGRAARGIAFFGLPGASPSSSPADFVANVRVLAALIRRFRYDVVHSSRPTAHLMAALASGRGTPLVHLRGSAQVPSAHVANRFLYRGMTSAVLVSSARIEGWLTDRLGLEPSRVHIVHAPVADAWFEPAVAADPLGGLGVARGAPVVLNVARLAPVKGHAHLLEAMAVVLKSVPEAVLVLAGEPWSGQPEGLATRARELGVANSVVFAGRRDDVRQLVGAAAVCVTSSIGSEENSRAVAEYMAAGRPVVATSVGVIPELVVEGATGLLVPPADGRAMATAILDLLRHPGEADRMGAAGRESARERFSRAAFAARLEAALRTAGVKA